MAHSRISIHPLNAPFVCNFSTGCPVTFSSKYIVSVLLSDAHPNTCSVKHDFSILPLIKVLIKEKNPGAGRRRPTNIPTLRSCSFCCSRHKSRPSDEPRSCNFSSCFASHKVQNCQYEMRVDEAEPALAALICRFPDELDLRI